MKTTDYVELALPCGARIGLLVTIDARRDSCQPRPCITADQVARMLLREWHREEVSPATRP